MPRKKPTSTRQKKEERQIQRAVKRGDIPPPPPKQPRKKYSLSTSDSSLAAQSSSRKLQSSFIKVSSSFLEETKALSSTLALRRPIPTEAAILTRTWADDTTQSLICPRRPKWRFDMSKKEVERNEEGFFRKWLQDTDDLIAKWQKDSDESEHKVDEALEDQRTTARDAMPQSPTYFERNLDVWRQLWRVTEISQIVLVLLDSRCPLLHFPLSLANYLSNCRVILVLTKTDIAGAARTAAWNAYFCAHYPDLPIVQVESYAVKEAGSYHQGRAHYEPHIPRSFKEELVMSIKKVHEEMKDPPDKVKANHKWLQTWKSPVKKDINWDAVLTAGGRAGDVVGGPAVSQPQTQQDESKDIEQTEPEFLTIGLIGQPNVGKSSLLNALFGKHKVRASKTPGKTKHFQTLFWTSDVRLVDCPGLVMPNYMPMEMQVLSGVLPISRIAAIPACIHYASQLLPLEEILGLSHPSASEPLAVDKRTWRDGMKKEGRKENNWTAMDVLVGYANQRGWVTAKAGRPDYSRAGNALLRALAEGHIPWAFWPPGTSLDIIERENEAGHGIWIKQGGNEAFGVEDSDSSDGEGVKLEAGDEDDGGNFSDSSTELGEDEVEVEEKSHLQSTLGRFAMLDVIDGEDEDE